MIVLGVDPGTAATGFGVVERQDTGTLRLVECGVIRTASRRPLPERLATIHAELTDIIERQRIDVLAVESVFVARNARSALVLGHARGVVLLAAATHGIEVAEYAPRAVKQTVAGIGSASKNHVGLMVARRLRLSHPPRPSDASDGVAVALTHCLRTKPVRRAAVI